jgi:hypothetical protein
MKKSVFKTISVPGICLIMLSMFTASCGSNVGGNGAQTNAASNTSAAPANDAPKLIKVGDHLKTEYFDIVVNSVKLDKSVNTGNPYTNLKPEEGNVYVIIDLTLKNTDKETRMMFDGSLVLDDNGKQMKYEQAETVLADGYGIIMENINPGITKRTKLVYKIPADAKGVLYYHPSRSGEDAMIALGKF